jgi:type I restriction enzyme R subunit
MLRDKYVLTLDNGKTVYLDFFSYDTDRNIYQVAHQITMDPAHKDDVSYKNRYDVTVLMNGLPLIQVELKRPGVEINEAINQINRYRKFSFKGLFRYLQLFVVSNSVQTKYFCNENEMQDGMYNPILKSLVFFWTDEKNKRINTLEEFTSSSSVKRQSLDDDNFMVIKSTETILMVMRPIRCTRKQQDPCAESQSERLCLCLHWFWKNPDIHQAGTVLRDEPRIDKFVFLIVRKDLSMTRPLTNTIPLRRIARSLDSTYVW